MVFSEVYGVYYEILSEILGQAVNQTLTAESMETIIREKGFAESILSIPQNLRDGTWPLLRGDLTTPLEHSPTMPLTTLQKRWMKALLQDPRIRLFDPPADGLEDVESLYPPDTFVYFDRYHDGDPYDSPQYRKHFRMILEAVREKRWLWLRYTGRNGIPHTCRCIPYKLEYSSKDDKFRIITRRGHSVAIINLVRIADCKVQQCCTAGEYQPGSLRRHILVLELTDERNALERVMYHFSHFEKRVEQLENRRYRLTVHYEKDDETELLIRVLSFGPVLKVISPDHFKEAIQDRLKKQMHLRAQK